MKTLTNAFLALTLACIICSCTESGGIYIYSLTVCFISACLFVVFYYKRHKLITKQHHDKELRSREQKYRQILEYAKEKEDENRMLKKQLEKMTDKLEKELLDARYQIETNDVELMRQMRILKEEWSAEFKTSPLFQTLFFSRDKLKEEDWANFITYMNNLYPDMIQYLKTEVPAIGSKKLCLCAMVRMGLQGKRISDLFGISESAVSKNKERLYKQLTGESGGAKKLDIFLSETFTET